MYLMYVDESGDCGIKDSSTNHFILCGLIIHETRWREYLDRPVDFRRRMKDAYGLKLREEIHSKHFINRPGDLVRIKRNDRLSILRYYARELAKMNDFRIIVIDVKKSDKEISFNVFNTAWARLIQRFENTIGHRNFPAGFPTMVISKIIDKREGETINIYEKGLIISDDTDNKKLRSLLRKMRRYNPIPHDQYHGSGYRDLQLEHIVEDPDFRSSEHSYFIQSIDLAAYLYKQSIEPNSYMRKKGGQNYFNILEPILCKEACRFNRLGIVVV